MLSYLLRFLGSIFLEKSTHISTIEVLIVTSYNQATSIDRPQILVIIVRITLFVVVMFEEEGMERKRKEYERNGIVYVGRVENIKELADEVISTAPSLDKVLESYESVKILRDNRIEKRKVLTRLENFVCSNKNWRELTQRIGTWVGRICGDDDGKDANNWFLYKEKLNLKPAGGTGYAPHLDNPSLMITGLSSDFVTVMIAIDDMTVENGCFQAVKGTWNESNALKYKTPKGGDPDRDGRAGELELELELKTDLDLEKDKYDEGSPLSGLPWESYVCSAGDVYIFNGWVPHRSGPNTTQQDRRAVFLTYNPPEDGELRGLYYHLMNNLRESAKKERSVLSQENTLGLPHDDNDIDGNDNDIETENDLNHHDMLRRDRFTLQNYIPFTTTLMNQQLR